jgi:hypothetical protein
MICPQCRSVDCARARRGGISDLLASCFRLRPWVCDTCDYRFYARRVAFAFARYAHCPRCGNFDLERIPRERVQNGNLLYPKRLGFRGYRCDPCRFRFFSRRPFRPIFPSLKAAPVRNLNNNS